MSQDVAVSKFNDGLPVAGKTNAILFAAATALVIGVAGGIYAQVIGHHHAFANTREVAWGMLIGVYAYFAIISTGLCLMAAISHIFHIKHLTPLANRMVWMSITVLFAAFTVIGLEIESPWRMPLGVVLHPNITSNIWWMGALYGLAVCIMLVEFFLIYNKKYSLAFWLGISGAIAEAFANSNLGSVFASLAARPFWYGSQLPIFFLGSAFMSGAAAVILFTHYSNVLKNRKISADNFQGIRFAGKIMTTMIFLILLAVTWKIVNAYCGTDETVLAAEALTKGQLSTTFWVFEIGIGLALPFCLMLATRLKSAQAMSLAALMVLVGQFFARYNLVVAGLIVPQFYGFEDYPTYLSYAPTAAEYSLVLGGFGVVGLGFILGEKYFSKVFESAE